MSSIPNTITPDHKDAATSKWTTHHRNAVPFSCDRLGWDLTLGRPLAALAPEIRCCDWLGTLLLEHLAGPEFAIVLDAMRAGLPPGSIRCFAPQELEDSASENVAKFCPATVSA